MKPWRPKLGIAPINWSNDDIHDLGADCTLDRCLGEMSATGYAGTELGHKFPTDPVELKAVLGRYDLTLASAWHSTHFVGAGSIADELEKFRRKASLLRTVGALAINVAETSGSVHTKSNIALDRRPVFSNHDWKNLVLGLTEASAIAGDIGMKIAYHHHLGTGIQTGDEVDRLLSSVKTSHFGLCADTGHCLAAGDDPLDLFQRHRNRIVHVHFKDIRSEVLGRLPFATTPFLRAVVEGLFTVPGDGAIDFEPILRILSEDRYPGWIIVEAEQDPQLANPANYATMARTYLSQTIAKLERT